MYTLPIYFINGKVDVCVTVAIFLLRTLLIEKNNK